MVFSGVSGETVPVALYRGNSIVMFIVIYRGEIVYTVYYTVCILYTGEKGENSQRDKE